MSQEVTQKLEIEAHGIICICKEENNYFRQKIHRYWEKDTFEYRRAATLDLGRSTSEDGL